MVMDYVTKEDLVTVDPAALRKAYDAAVEAGADEFEFGGSPWVTNYAKYILEILSGRRSTRHLAEVISGWGVARRT
jgi:hypothetical protein